jgi:hypothetical protein
MLNRRWPFSGRWVCAPEPHWITNPRRRVCSTPSTSGAPAPERSRKPRATARAPHSRATDASRSRSTCQPTSTTTTPVSKPKLASATGTDRPWSNTTPRCATRSPCGTWTSSTPRTVRRSHRDLGRHHYLGLACQIHLRLLATDHRDPAGGHRRQPGNRRGPGLDPAAHHSAVPGLRQRLLRSHRCVQPITRGRAQDPAPAAQPHLHVRARGAANLDSGHALDQDVIDARVWLGIHFRTADTDGVRMGTRAADWILDHYFQRTPGDHED